MIIKLDERGHFKDRVKERGGGDIEKVIQAFKLAYKDARHGKSGTKLKKGYGNSRKLFCGNHKWIFDKANGEITLRTYATRNTKYGIEQLKYKRKGKKL